MNAPKVIWVAGVEHEFLSISDCLDENAHEYHHASVLAAKDAQIAAAKRAFYDPINYESFNTEIGGRQVTNKGETEFVRKSEVERVLSTLHDRVMAALDGQGDAND